MDIGTATDVVNVEAKGGNGADHVSMNNWKHGPGGGAGGGVIALAQAVTSSQSTFILNVG